MTRLSNEWLRPRRARDNFPPYALGERDIVETIEAKTAKVARIYQKSHDLAWDGKKVLAELKDEHGGIQFPDDKREAFGRIASVLLWGELAAWSVSADLALKLEDNNAKLAASSQVFDEARHFNTLRAYLWEAGIPIPKLSGYSRQLLVDLLETDNLLYKLVGMQLMVENVAVVLFKMIARAEIEPVLTELLYYFERDEARHVGLGALTLPRILADLTDFEAAKLWWFQMRMQLLMVGGGLTMRDAFTRLGVDQAEMQRQGFRLQTEVYRRMQDEYGGEASGVRRRGTRGLFGLSRGGQDRLNQFLFPRRGSEGDAPPAWHALALKGLIRAAERGDRWLARRAPAT
jgi:hypothetical protein